MIYKSILASAVLLTLTACGGSEEDSTNKPPSPEGTPVVEPTPIPTTKPTEIPVATPTPMPTPIPEVVSIQLNGGQTELTVAGCTPFAIVADAAEGQLVNDFNFIFTPGSGLTAITGGENTDLSAQNETALFVADNNVAGTFDVTVDYTDGVQDYSASIAVNVEENITCRNNDGWSFYDFNTLTTPNGLTINDISQPYQGSGLASPIASLAFSANQGMPSVNGVNSGAFQITVLTPDSVDSPTLGRGAGWYTNAFSENNFWARNFNTSDVGKEYNSSVWVKLNQLPNDEITLTQWIMPWRREGRTDTCFHFACGDSGGEIAVTATLLPTTQWQQVKFPTIVVPDTFTTSGSATMAYIFRGAGIAAGDTYLMDNMAITAVETPVEPSNFSVEYSATAVAAGWNGLTIPPGQQCVKDNGNGDTPEFTLTNVPAGTASFRVEYNDTAWNGGLNGFHGIIGYTHNGSDTATLVSFPGNTEDTADFPPQTSLIRANGGFGDWAFMVGYMPPCSGGSNNLYQAEIFALDASGNSITSATIDLARY